MKRLTLIVFFLCSLACAPQTGGGAATALAAPGGVTLRSATASSLIFEWEAVPGATVYEYALSLAGKVAAGKQGAGKTAIISDLASGTEYEFKVRAGAGNDCWSDWSAPLTASTKESVQPGPDPGPGPDPTPGPDDPKVSPEVYAQFLMPASEAELPALAFPGAEGGGMYTTGGRGGRVIHVTTLADSGSGSLREALGQSGSRTIVFDVAGTIDLNSTLKVQKGDVTVAGQTAPGDGICISGYDTDIQADNVIFRFVRFRMGNLKGREGDAVGGRYHSHIIFDHCSMSWSTDECASFYGNENFTLQWCLLTESLRNSLHEKGAHGYGGIWGGKNASFHHNFLANHDNRTPRFDHPHIYENWRQPARRGNVDYRNNVNYNWGSGSGCYGGEDSHINMVGNYYKPGPASSNRKFFIEADGIYKASKNEDTGEKGTFYYTHQYPYLYLSGNVHTQYADITADNAQGIYWAISENPDNHEKISSAGHVVSAPHAIAGSDGKDAFVTTHAAQKAFSQVLAYAGASLRRDVVDTRAVADATTGIATYPNGGNGSTGGIIDNQDAVGGWPQLTGTALPDTDGDGMPDAFEDTFGLDKTKADGNACNLDILGRYTNLEMYLHYLVREIIAAQNAEGTYTKL